VSESAARFHAIISGQVQGVGFRYFAAVRARSLRLSGWVRNLPDGRVEVAAQGPRHALDSLVSLLRTGPRKSKVDSVELNWLEPTPAEGAEFDVRF
jgi:acylphosphatase